MKISFRQLLFAYNIGKKAYKIIKKDEKLEKKPELINQIITTIYNERINSMQENKWASRKFLTTLVTVVIMLLGAFISPDAVAEVEKILMAVIALVGIYNVGQSHVDAKKEIVPKPDP